MFLNVSKATAVLALSTLAGTLFAATPAQLGSDCARFTMEGLVHLARIERFGLEEDRKALGTYQDMASECVIKALELKSKAEVMEFWQAGLAFLKTMNLKNGAEVVGLKQKDCARLSFLKFVAIDSLENILVVLAQLPVAQISDVDGTFIFLFHEVLGQPGVLDGDESLSRAVSNACTEVYGFAKSNEIKRLRKQVGTGRFFNNAYYRFSEKIVRSMFDGMKKKMKKNRKARNLRLA